MNVGLQSFNTEKHPLLQEAAAMIDGQISRIIDLARSNCKANACGLLTAVALNLAKVETALVLKGQK